ncbi:hypothetical protein Bca52824_012222 [Brassica carinata]|uniref:Uncharacterized protein n=1 Tax=Brassica carinata TaxID=52824 RepID=A0A8X7VWR7_BRACI|nr:hypothetical protein Bca52824_012222 [Brassica carinata]
MDQLTRYLKNFLDVILLQSYIERQCLLKYTKRILTHALQIYRVASLLLNFLYLQAESVVKRAERVGYVGLAHFPELLEPEMLHGLQKQAKEIVAELYENCREVPDEVKKLCLLRLQMTEICRSACVLGTVYGFAEENSCVSVSWIAIEEDKAMSQLLSSPLMAASYNPSGSPRFLSSSSSVLVAGGGLAVKRHELASK